MLFSYKPLETFHSIENYNLYVEYFFENLFVNEFENIDELIHTDFQNIYNTHSRAIGDKLRNIHQAYLILLDEEKIIIQRAFENNKQIEEICNNNLDPIKYDDLPSSIKNELKSFFNTSWTMLTNKDEDTNSVIKDRCGNIYEHYCELFSAGRQMFTICPVCGLEELLGEFEACDDLNDNNQKKVREAYDHYFPKSLYPFISVNFFNLIPICHHCNSDYKHDYDTAYNVEDGQRQECYYPFSEQGINDIDIEITTTENIVNLNESIHWQIEITSSIGANERIASWNRIFDIRLRYKKRIKTKEQSWKKRLFLKIQKKNEQTSWDDFKTDLYDDIDIINQSNAVVQKVYYDYFFDNLLDGYIEEIA